MKLRHIFRQVRVQYLFYHTSSLTSSLTSSYRFGFSLNTNVKEITSREVTVWLFSSNYWQEKNILETENSRRWTYFVDAKVDGVVNHFKFTFKGRRDDTVYLKIQKFHYFYVCLFFTRRPFHPSCVFFEPPPLGEKGSYDFTTVSMSVGKGVFSETSHTIFVKLLLKLGYLKDKNWRSQIFGKKSHFGDNAQKHSKNRVFWIWQKKGHWYVDFWGLDHTP